MANKLILFAAFAALVQASSAASSAASSDIRAAYNGVVTNWWLAASTAYDTMHDPSSSLRSGGHKHLSYLLAGSNAFLEVAVPSDQLATVKNETIAVFEAVRDYVFQGIAVGRRCRDWFKTLSAIDEIREKILEKRWVEEYYDLVGATGPQTPAVDAFRDIYDALFRTIKSLAAYECGITSEIESSCGAFPAIKVLTDVLFASLSDRE